jgi:hypothetical protein
MGAAASGERQHDCDGEDGASHTANCSCGAERVAGTTDSAADSQMRPQSQFEPIS